MDNLVGQTLERYQILTLLGEGGMGAVYKAHDITLQRDVAIKVLHAQFARRPDFRERFLNEARTAARMNHPGIVQVHDFGQQGEILYIVMEFIPGANLYQMLADLRSKGNWIRLDEAVELLRQVCLALDYAHRQGILHRDIKPGNIMLKPEPVENLPFRPVITDLGLAKLLEGAALTQEGTSMGTPAYMSPEQAMGHKTDPRSDVYSLGILLYELAVGQLPFPIKSLTEAMRYHTTEPPPPPSSLRADLPPLLEKTIMLALEKDPANRPPNAGELAKGLKAVAASFEAQEMMPTALGEAVSLVTQYQASLLEVRGPSVLDDFAPASDLSKDRIQVMVNGETTHSVTIPSGGLTIGRDVSCNLVIDDRKASRKHARIDYDGAQYRVTDLNSSNGTFLANAKLLPGVSEVWTPEKPLRIGDTWLRLLRAEGSYSSASIIRTDGSLVDPASVRSSQGQGRVSVFIEPGSFQVEPGRSVSITILMLNQGSVVDHFRVAVRGLPNTWTPALPEPVQLMPGAQQSVTLNIQPPRQSQSRAGEYKFTVRVTSQDAPGESVDTNLTLAVGPYSGFSSEFYPQRVSAGKAARVTVKNQGNQKEAYRLSWRDRGEEVAFRPPQATLEVEEGKSASVEFTAIPRNRRWFGSEQIFPFNVQVAAPNGEAQSHSGEVVSKAALPSWLVPAFLTLCVLVAGAAALTGYFSYSQSQIAQNTTATARAFVATQVVANMTQTAIPALTQQAEQATATAFAVADASLKATQAAGTAQAKGDDDGDGLSNARELALGTDPNNPDTDGDGLSDGDEVNRYGTNPLMRDTDGDNLSDGEEVSLGLNPQNPDTDGDGLMDNVDPDPKLQPTATPKPPPDGLSMNCDDTYQRFRLKDGGEGVGTIVVVDLWENETWVERWSFSSNDPEFHTIDIATTGFYTFLPCQTLLVIPVKAAGTGGYLDVNVFYWTGNTIDLTFSVTSLAKGAWYQVDNRMFAEYAVYYFGEPEAAPCNRGTDGYIWNNGLFAFDSSFVNPTYSGDPPPECTMVAAQPTLDILIFKPQLIITPIPAAVFQNP
jgi:eukaryotic-like serine/threonine-protein kinase